MQQRLERLERVNIHLSGKKGEAGEFGITNANKMFRNSGGLLFTRLFCVGLFIDRVFCLFQLFLWRWNMGTWRRRGRSLSQLMWTLTGEDFYSLRLYRMFHE